MPATFTDYEPAPGGAYVTTGLVGSLGSTAYQTSAQIDASVRADVAAAVAANGPPSAFGEGLAELVTNPLQFFSDAGSVASDIGSGVAPNLQLLVKLLEVGAIFVGVAIIGYIVYKVAK